jgi:hypothetical protein
MQLKADMADILEIKNSFIAKTKRQLFIESGKKINFSKK